MTSAMTLGCLNLPKKYPSRRERTTMMKAWTMKRMRGLVEAMAEGRGGEGAEV